MAGARQKLLGSGVEGVESRKVWATPCLEPELNLAIPIVSMGPGTCCQSSAPSQLF